MAPRINLLRFGCVRLLTINPDPSRAVAYRGVMVFDRPPEIAEREGGAVTGRPLGPLAKIRARVKDTIRHG